MLQQLAKLVTPWWKSMAFPVGAIGGWLLPDPALAGAFATVGLFVLLDLATGLGAAWNERRFQGSTGIRRTIFKVISYGSAILVDIHLPRNVPFIDGQEGSVVSVTGITAVILLTEAVSIFENIRRMGIQFPEAIEDELRKRMSRAGEPPDSGNPPGGQP